MRKDYVVKVSIYGDNEREIEQNRQEVDKSAQFSVWDEIVRRV